MQLKDLERFNPITIQCHDNPDADTLGSGFALYNYFQEKGKTVRLVYSGRNRIQKPNLVLMVEKLEIPVEYVDAESADKIRGLLITVDCQYGAGNVTKLLADEVAIIDHHQKEIHDIPFSRIQSNLGSCSTLVWKLFDEEHYKLTDTKVGTALYYGLYTDTNQFSEIYNPLDMDMREDVPCNKSLITMFRNSNLSLKELEIAGIALLRYIYNDDYEFALIKAQPCDPNILGLISDFLLQVDKIKTCVVYNELSDVFKLSVRSCIKEVNASELAAYLTEGIGSGGGHMEKAGGFISRRRYGEKYPNLHSEAYISNRMKEYFDTTEIIYAREYEIDVTDMEQYQEKKCPIGFVKADEVLPVGTLITIRTLAGDVDMVVAPDLYILFGIKGQVYPNSKEKFERSYQITEGEYSLEECTVEAEYTPTIKNRVTGETTPICKFAHKCIPAGDTFIYAKPLEKRMKVFAAGDEEKYMLGVPGDYLAVRCDDLHDIFIVEKNIFGKIYERKENV